MLGILYLSSLPACQDYLRSSCGSCGSSCTFEHCGSRGLNDEQISHHALPFSLFLSSPSFHPTHAVSCPSGTQDLSLFPVMIELSAGLVNLRTSSTVPSRFSAIPPFAWCPDVDR